MTSNIKLKPTAENLGRFNRTLPRGVGLVNRWAQA